MAECVDIYSDLMQLGITPFGCVMTFYVSGHPLLGGKEISQPEKVLVLRMSLEHAKAMAQVIHRNLKKFEEQELKATIPLVAKAE